MPPAPLLTLQNVHQTFGGTPLLVGAELAIGAGERLCLVGRNGSGKSSLLKIAAGELIPDKGERVLQGGVTIRYLAQEPDLSGYETTLAYVEAGLGPSDDAYRAPYLLERLGFTGEESPATLSGGEARRCALARVLAPEPDVLMLDEPTNHLDLPAIEWLEEELRGLRSALVLISHDRRFLQNLSRATLWLDRGVTRRLDKGFGEFEAWRDEVLEQEELERHKLDRKIVDEEHWVRYGVSGRRKRNVRRMRDLQGLRQQRRDQRQVAGSVKMTVSEGETSGKLVFDVEDISKSFGAQTVVRDLTLRVLRGDRLGIIGPNGAGKSTLLKMLTGALEPDGGKIKRGANLQTVTLDQGRAMLDPEMTLKNALTGGTTSDYVMVGDQRKHVISYMKDFLFTPEQARTPVGVLSGGERGRLMLARALALPSNLLVLDEPTNDLDLETLDLLEEMIADYPGTALVVSHDRDFLDRVATSVIAFEGDGKWIEYAGGYSDMVAQRGEGVTAKNSGVKPATKAEVKAAKAASAAKKKLGFKEQHALKTLPEQMAKLEKQAAELQAKLADPQLFVRDAAKFAATAAELEKVQAELAKTEEDWLALEMLREEIEG
ncbi:MAG TPA: ATP-binding cassette domain-containing protein [Alphaproteobacteria bacterium]